jgi:RIO kinase 1
MFSGPQEKKDKNLTKYISGDTRFRNVPRDRKGIIFLWAQKEFKNLSRMFNAGIATPEPKKQLRNVMVMSYIGNEEQAAPMMKDVSLKNPKKNFDTILKMMKELYSEARLIHGDLSEYNVLVYDDEPFLIDVGQSVVLEHPLAEELLIRDVANMSRYFRKLGVKSEENEMMSFIKGE